MDFTEQSWINNEGTKCVLEANWHDRSGDRCQMIWQLDRGGVMITTCHPDVPPIWLTSAQMVSLGFFLRGGSAGSGSERG